MRVFCAGFNLYGQFQNINDICIESFQNIYYKDIVDIQISHSFLIIHSADSTNKQKICLHGFFKDKLHQIKELQFGNNFITEISVSDTQALFLSNDGKIFSLVNNLNKSTYDLSPLPDFVRTENNESDDLITKIASGTCISCAVSQNGDIYSLPSKLNYQIPNVKQICAGREHCLILIESGFVYSFGSGSRGQLGHGDLEDRTVPCLINHLAGLKITKIGCGSWHSAALTEEGDLYTWGWNSNGQLGLQTNTNKTNDSISIMGSPHLIELDGNIADVSCGSRHTVILLDNGKLFGCGWNKYCQLGFRSNEENLNEMSFLYDFNGMKIFGIRCGSCNTAVLINE